MAYNWHAQYKLEGHDWDEYQEGYPVLEDALKRLIPDSSVTLGCATSCVISMNRIADSAGQAYLETITAVNRVSGIARMPRWAISMMTITRIG